MQTISIEMSDDEYNLFVKASLAYEQYPEDLVMGFINRINAESIDMTLLGLSKERKLIIINDSTTTK